MPQPATPKKVAPERRQYWIAAIVLFVAIVGLTAISTLFMASKGDGDPIGTPKDTAGAKLHAIPRPGEGQAPRFASDRGGWEQYLVLGMTMGGMAALAGLAWRSSRRARARAGRGENRPGLVAPPHPTGGPRA